MPYTDDGKNQMLDNLGVTHASANSGGPSSSNFVELDRVSVTMNASSSGVISMSSAVDFSIAANSTVTDIGFHPGATTGTLLAFGTVTNETFSSSGTYTLTAADLDLNLTT